MRLSSFLLSILFPALLLLFSSCTTHPQRISRLKNDLAAARQPDPAFLRESIDPESRNGLLFLLERFRLQQLIGNTSASSSDFMAAHDFDRKQEAEKPVLAFSDLLNQTSAILINDNTLPYRLNDFERVMLYQLQIFNSMTENPENLAPLINNLTAYQQRIREKHADAFQKAEKTLQSTSNKEASASWRLVSENPEFQSRTAENLQVAQMLRTLENAYAYYLCGVFFESQGKSGDAFLAYQAALRLQPTNQIFQKDVARIGGLLGKTPELQQFDLVPLPAQLPDGHGEIVLFFEEGYIPSKQSFKLPPIPIPTGYGLLLINLALPVYLPAQSLPSQARISFPGGTVNTELAADLRNLAVKALTDKMPEIVARMSIRAIARATANYAMLKSAKEISDPGQRDAAVFLLHLQQIFVHAIEEPDLRSWLLLPNFTQVARFSLPEGTQQIRFQHRGLDQKFSVNVIKGRTTVAHCMAVPGRLTFASAVLPTPTWK
ncbi:MAG: hypothetical protein GX927_09270 [Lentisphaerae bacterium]|jgi:hypothetical protein|nr:hypothetical protein [Lentisphaerota bacterium]